MAAVDAADDDCIEGGGDSGVGVGRGRGRDRYEHIVDNLDYALAAHTRLHEALRPQSLLSFSPAS